MSKQFKDLDINPILYKATVKMGYETMTPIQEQSFEPIIAGKDIMALAPTGTGKTCAFGLPILEGIDPREKMLSTIVLCPTRELARQTTDVLHNLSTYVHGIKVVAIYGGESIRRQIQRLKGKPQIIVATPGRMMDHMKRRTIRLNSVRNVVLDEADRMLDMGFRFDIDKIISATPKDRQMLLFSATLSNEVRYIAKKYLKDPANVKIEGDSRTVETITQYTAEMKKSKKMDAMIDLLKDKSYKSVLVFTNMKYTAGMVAKKLKQSGFDSTALHGDLDQKQRDAVMKKYREGKVTVLVATDVASRGLDVLNIDAVINYDIPDDSDSYVHRIGRTGRANKTGDAYTLLDPTERRKMQSILKGANTKAESIMLQDQADIDEYDNKIKAKSLAFSRGTRPRRGRKR